MGSTPIVRSKFMVYHLKITSWAERTKGYQSGASHYFGTIRAKGSKGVHYLTHVVEVCDPAYEDSSLRCATAKPGETMETNRFITTDQVWWAAREWMKENAQPEDELVKI